MRGLIAVVVYEPEYGCSTLMRPLLLLKKLPEAVLVARTSIVGAAVRLMLVLADRDRSAAI